MNADHNFRDVRYNGFSGLNHKQQPKDDGVICNTIEQERFLDYNMKSSYTFFLSPGTTINSCRRLFIPSDDSGILIRLSKLRDDGVQDSITNISSYCPMTFVSVDC